MLQIRIKQGKGGQFRWLLYEDDVFAGMSHIQGYASRSLAELAAKRHFGEWVELHPGTGDPDLDHPQYAGPRDWAD